jgi:Glycosyl transferase family 2
VGDDGLQIVKARLPPERRTDSVAGGYDLCWVARPPECELDLEVDSGDTFDGVNHVQHREAAAITAIEPRGSAGSAGHASATASLKLTFHPDHSEGANQSLKIETGKIAVHWRSGTVRGNEGKKRSGHPPQMNPRVAVLIPCYNEAVTIAKVVRDFSTALPSARIYVYDNNSTDRTAEAA